MNRPPISKQNPASPLAYSQQTVQPIVQPSANALSRIGMIGDVHGQAERLQTVITHLKNEGVEALVCTGDITDGFGDVDRCCDLLQAANVITVLGNHDRWCIHNELRNRADCTLFEQLSPKTQTFLSQLPTQVELNTVAGRALLCHGLGANDMGKLLPKDDAQRIAQNAELQALLQQQRYRYVLNGHSHYRMVKPVDELVVINGGTLRRGHQPGFLHLDFAQARIQAYDLLPDSPPEINRDVEASPLGAKSDLAKQLARDKVPAQPVAAMAFNLPIPAIAR